MRPYFLAGYVVGFAAYWAVRWLLDKLQRVITDVKPLDPTLFSGAYLTITWPMWRSVLDDWRRYGLRVAAGNLWELLK